jgi:transcriptional regulator with XRE-family HTH domain
MARKPEPLVLILERYRVEKGMSVTDMCQRAGLGTNVWYVYRAGGLQPSMTSLRAFAKALGFRVVLAPLSGAPLSPVQGQEVNRVKGEFAVARENLARIDQLLEEVGDRLTSQIEHEEMQ